MSLRSYAARAFSAFSSLSMLQEIIDRRPAQSGCPSNLGDFFALFEQSQHSRQHMPGLMVAGPGSPPSDLLALLACRRYADHLPLSPHLGFVFRHPANDVDHHPPRRSTKPHVVTDSDTVQ